MSYKNESNSYVKDKSPAKILGPDHVGQRHNRNASKTKWRICYYSRPDPFETIIIIKL